MRWWCHNLCALRHQAHSARAQPRALGAISESDWGVKLARGQNFDKYRCGFWPCQLPVPRCGETRRLTTNMRWWFTPSFIIQRKVTPLKSRTASLLKATKIIPDVYTPKALPCLLIGILHHFVIKSTAGSWMAVAEPSRRDVIAIAWILAARSVRMPIEAEASCVVTIGADIFRTTTIGADRLGPSSCSFRLFFGIFLSASQDLRLFFAKLPQNSHEFRPSQRPLFVGRSPLPKFQNLEGRENNLGPGNTRTHCGGNMYSIIRCCPSVARRGNIAVRCANTINVSKDFQKHF